MAYESRIFIINRSEIEREGKEPYIFAEKIADIKMCKMYDGFTDLFKTKIDYDVYIDDENDFMTTDKYGDVMTYTDCKTVIDYLEKLMADGENYRRLPILLGLLKSINEKQWNEIQVVHYGY